MRCGQVACFNQRWIDVDQADRNVRSGSLGYAGPGPHKRHVGSSFPQRVFAPLAFFAKVIAVIAPQYADVIARLRKSAPTQFADPQPKLNARRDLVVEGETFRWEKGKGNYVPHPKYLPYTDPAMKQQKKATR